MIIYRKVIKSYIHTIRYMGYEHFLNPILKINLVLNPFFCWIRIRFVFAWIRIRITVRPGSGSVKFFFTSWIRIRIKMIRIHHTELY